jgi:TolA-binding protein
MAELILSSARKGYNEKNYPVAIARYREFLAKFGNHKDANAARYGLALSLIESPTREYGPALEQLAPLAGAKDFPDHPFVLYYLGAAQRGLGNQELAQAIAKPNEAPQRRQAAAQKFDEAGKQFAAATTAFTERVKPEPAPDAKELPADFEWAARARCDQAEMFLRTQKAKEARDTALPFTKAGALAKSKYHGLGLYYHGFASFLLQDYQAAGRSLGLVAPLNDPIFGLHARYLLGRTHQMAEELTEATVAYDGVLAEYAKQKLAAIEALKQPDRFKDDPDEKARVEALARGPVPDYVGRSTFYLATLLYEGGKFGEALPRFTAFIQEQPQSPLHQDAVLRQGFCMVQMKDYDNGMRVLQPLTNDPRLADQALLWTAKAVAGKADPANADQYRAQMTNAFNLFRQAAERAQQASAQDPDAKVRRADALIESADAQQLLHQHKEAATTYEQIINEKVVPQRDEDLLQRRISALHLAGDFAAADQACTQFQTAYPKSPFLAAIAFRFAENAYFGSLAAEKNPDVNVRTKEVARLQEEAAKRYRVVVDKYPEFAQVNLARFGLAMTFYRKGEYEKAKAAFDTIPGTDRGGDLAAVSYLLADCLIRLTPTKTEDSIATAKAKEQLQEAAGLLDGFFGADQKGALAPDALLKLGLCYQQMASLEENPQQRAQTAQVARTKYEALMQLFPQSPLKAQAYFERAKTIALQGDKNGAMNELRQFFNDPWKGTPAAPLALLQLANLLREQNKNDEAAKVLADCRAQHEQALLANNARVDVACLLAYHQAAALRDAGKFGEAKALFDHASKIGGNRPEAIDALLRVGQCQQQEAIVKIDAAQKRLATPNLKPEELAQAANALNDGYKEVAAAAQYFEAQVAPLKQKMAPPESIARVYYEAAWTYRKLAEPEVASVRTKMQQDLLKKTQDEELKKDPNYKPPAVVSLPDVPLAQVPLQPSETKAREKYQAIIKEFEDVPLAVDSRLELAELVALRGDQEGAVKLLKQALEKEPNPVLTDKVRLRLGASLASLKDTKGALALFDQVAKDPKSPLLAQAHYRAGECLVELGDYNAAVARLARFRDDGQYQNVPGVSDRALLLLGQSYAALRQWGPSMQALQTLIGRFGNSPWVHEARYGFALAQQNNNDLDGACNTYNQVVAGTATEVAARAQLQIGLCRMAQKKHADAIAAFLIVPFTYDYPDLTAAALVEAARAYAETQQKEQAERLLQRVIRDHGKTKWAGIAKERLEALNKS